MLSRLYDTVRWRKDWLLDGLAELMNAFDGDHNPPLFLAWAILLIVGGLPALPLAMFSEAVAAGYIGFWLTVAQPLIGVTAVAAIRRGRLSGGLPYGWMRSGHERWLEDARNEEHGYSRVYRQVEIMNPRRGDREWRDVLGVTRRNKRTKRVLLDSTDHPMKELENYRSLEVQEELLRLESGESPPDDDGLPKQSDSVEKIPGTDIDISSHYGSIYHAKR